MSDTITFLASIPALQSAIMVHGGGDGMRVKLEIPETQMGNALELLAMRGMVLQITIAVVGDGNGTRKSKRIQF